MQDLTDFQKIKRLHAIGQRITKRVLANLNLLGDDALIELDKRVTALMIRIAQRMSHD